MKQTSQTKAPTWMTNTLMMLLQRVLSTATTALGKVKSLQKTATLLTPPMQKTLEHGKRVNLTLMSILELKLPNNTGI